MLYFFDFQSSTHTNLYYSTTDSLTNKSQHPLDIRNRVESLIKGVGTNTGHDCHCARSLLQWHCWHFIPFPTKWHVDVDLIGCSTIGSHCLVIIYFQPPTMHMPHRVLMPILRVQIDRSCTWPPNPYVEANTWAATNGYKTHNKPRDCCASSKSLPYLASCCCHHYHTLHTMLKNYKSKQSTNG